LAGHPNRGKLARLLDPDEVTERDFWQFVEKTRRYFERNTDLGQSLQKSLVTVTEERHEWQAEF